MSFETQRNQTFWRDIPGFCRDNPGVPEKFEKRKVCVQFSSPKKLEKKTYGPPDPQSPNPPPPTAAKKKFPKLENLREYPKYCVCSKPSLKCVKEFLRFPCLDKAIGKTTIPIITRNGPNNSHWRLTATNRRLIVTNRRLIATND